jgi:acyl-homoserine lactone acylase PvdQ
MKLTYGRLLAVAVVLTALIAPSLATAQVEPYGTNNYGTFYNILPAGTNGTDTFAQLLAFKANGTYPAHSNDQLGMYSALTTAAPNIQDSQISSYFKDATFGVKPGNVDSSMTESPEPGVTIEFDKGFGVPHVYGDTRAELEFGIGWATAQTRLFEIDVLRHAGAGTLASFAGGSNAGMDEGTWEDAPYTQQDLQAQINYLSTIPGGQQVISDGQNYVDGVNAYIKMAEANPINQQLYLPGEYTAIEQPQGPAPFTLENIISIASLIGGELGQGGGDQLQTAVLYQQFKQRFGRERFNVDGSPEGALKGKRTPSTRHRDKSGFGSFLSFIDPNDPEAPTTVHGKKFPYQTLLSPKRLNRKSVALPDSGSVQWTNPVVSGSLPSGGGGGGLTGLTRRQRLIQQAMHEALSPTHGLLANFPTSDSNALLVSGKDTTNGHPIAVIGPQVSYFSPQILMEEDIHGPGIQADGASFPGTNIYVELGHGEDYAWSATSEGQNIIDTFAVPLCNPAGGSVSIDSDYYKLGSSCVQMQALDDSESWKPSLADSTAAGSVTFQTMRTGYGLVIARARIHGQPVVYTNLRSTYMHELDSATGFDQFDDPSQMATPQDFMNAAYRVGYTFNWFFINSKHIAYFGSGANPVRAAATDPLFPTWAKYPWKGFHPSAAPSPTTTTERDTAENAHPHTVDQQYLTSWNNKPAPGYDYVDGEYSSIYRSQLLDLNIEHYLDGGKHKMTLVELINAMGNAGTQDLRGVEVLPYALKILGNPSNPTLKTAVAELRAWVASGAHRINREHPSASGQYDQSAAIQIMDAWWPLLVNADLGPVLGSSLLGDVEGRFGIDNLPHNHQGSAWDVGFYGIVQKDLRSAAGDHVAGPLNRVYCGNGSLRRCRAALDSSLLQAANETPAQVYPASSGCAAGDQMCFDAIHYAAIGAITQPPQEWVNRPTFQQAVQIDSAAP